MAAHLTPGRFEDMFDTPAMDLWACLGGTTDRSVRVWARSRDGGPIPVTMQDGESVLAQDTLQPSADHDGVAHMDLTLDSPRPNRDVTVEVGGSTLRAHLAPEAGEPAAFSFLFGSCNQPFVRSRQRAVEGPAGGIYDSLVETARQQPARFAMLLGDQAYADGVKGLSVPQWVQEHDGVTDADILSAYREIYRAYFMHSGFKRLLEEMPSCMIWDDHEIFDSWGSHETRSETETRLFRGADVAYREYEHSHNPGRGLEAAPPYDYSFWYGNAGFFVFDLRSERDYRTGSLVGEAQWQRFEEFLTRAEQIGAPTIFVVATIPVVHFSPALIHLLGHLPGRKTSLARERWNSDEFQPHRRRLLARLFTWQTAAPSRKVILLSGDVHAAAAFSVTEQGGRGVISQWTSSALCTPTGIPHTVANRVGTAFVNLGDPSCRSTLLGLEPENNFGLVTVSPRQGGGHDVKLTISKYRAASGTLSTAFTAQA